MKPLIRFSVFVSALLILSACTPPSSSPAAAPPQTGASAPAAVVSATPPVPPPVPPKQEVTFPSGDLTLTGYVFRPAGDGPFPAIVWNHGSEQDPGSSREFDLVAAVFVPAGYVVIAPERRGHGKSQGEYIGDTLKKEGAQALAQEMAGPQLDDQLAGLAYLETLPYVDKSRIGVVGCSYGGIQTMMAAERGADYKAAVALSPGAESWNGNKPLQARMLQAADNAKIPVLLIHPAKDASTAPGYALAQELIKAGKPYGLMIFPPIGTDDQQGHCFGGGGGDKIWGPSALQFLAQYIH